MTRPSIFFQKGLGGIYPGIWVHGGQPQALRGTCGWSAMELSATLWGTVRGRGGGPAQDGEGDKSQTRAAQRVTWLPT